MSETPAPRVVTVPDGVTTDEAERALLLCRRLGVLDAPSGGWLLVPAGAWVPGLPGDSPLAAELAFRTAGEGLLDVDPDRPTFAPGFTAPVSWDDLVADERPWWRRLLRRLQFWRRKKCRPVRCPPFEQVYILGGHEAGR